MPITLQRAVLGRRNFTDLLPSRLGSDLYQVNLVLFLWRATLQGGSSLYFKAHSRGWPLVAFPKWSAWGSQHHCCIKNKAPGRFGELSLSGILCGDAVWGYCVATWTFFISWKLFLLHYYVNHVFTVFHSSLQERERAQIILVHINIMVPNSPESWMVFPQKFSPPWQISTLLLNIQNWLSSRIFKFSCFAWERHHDVFLLMFST